MSIVTLKIWFSCLVRCTQIAKTVAEVLGRMAVVTSTISVGEVLDLIASGAGQTRSSIARLTGLSRSTVTERLDALFDADLIREGVSTKPARGRPSKIITLNDDSRFVLAADIGEDHTRVVVTNLAGSILAERVGAMPVHDGAERTIGWIAGAGRQMLTDLDAGAGKLIGVALSVPAPVDFDRGEVTGPSIMTGWEGIALEPLVRRSLDVPVVVENDVNARGFGEYQAHWRDRDEIFYVKAGTGIGSAIISDGSIFRGANGAAGDIGHIRLEPESGPLCRCGSLGCVEAYAAGWSVVRDLAAAGFDVADTAAALALVRSGAPEAVRLVRQAGRALGRAIACGVSLLNPRLVVVSGSLAQVSEHLISGVRETVYQYSLPLATRELVVAVGRGDHHSGVLGAAHLAVRGALSPTRVNALFA
jgi:predicted NBD/HSP70 family sugar kinase